VSNNSLDTVGVKRKILMRDDSGGAMMMMSPILGRVVEKNGGSGKSSPSAVIFKNILSVRRTSAPTSFYCTVCFMIANEEVVKNGRQIRDKVFSGANSPGNSCGGLGLD
jgi:hypothetical protein